MGKTLDQCYQILGLDSSASGVDVKTAYKQLALKYHPDKNPDNPEATRKFQELGCAYKRITSGTNEDEEWCDEDEFTFEDILNFYCFVFRQELMTYTEKQTSEYLEKPFTEEEGKKQRCAKQGQKANKPKPKSNKQLRAEHWRRQQELSEVVTEIERKKKQELEKEALKASSQNKDVDKEDVMTSNLEAHNMASSLWKAKENVEEKHSKCVKTKKAKLKKKRKQVRKEEHCEERKSRPQEFGYHSSGIKTTAVNPGNIACFPRGHFQHVKVSTARTRTSVQRSCSAGSQKQDDTSQRRRNSGTTRVQNDWNNPHSTSPNIWHRRQQQHEFLSELQPLSENEAQKQLEMAIEMSKIQADIEASQRKVHALELADNRIEEEMTSLYMADTCSSGSVATSPPECVDTRVIGDANPSRNSPENVMNEPSYPTNRVTINIGDIERKARTCSADGSGVHLADDMGQQRVTEVKIPMKTFHASEEDQQLGHSDQPSQREEIQSSQRRRRRRKSCVYGKNCCLGEKCKFSHPKQTQNTKKPRKSGLCGLKVEESQDHSTHKGHVNSGSCSYSEPCFSKKNSKEGVFSSEDKYGLDSFSVQQDCQHQDAAAAGVAKEPELKSHGYPQSEQATVQYKLVECGENSKEQFQPEQRVQDHHQLEQVASLCKLVECEDSQARVSSGPVQGVQSTGNAKEPHLKVQDCQELGTSQYKPVRCGENSISQVSFSPGEREQSEEDAPSALSNHLTKEWEAERQDPTAPSVKSEGTLNEGNQFLKPKLEPINMSTSGAWFTGCVPPNVFPQATVYHTNSLGNLSSVPPFPPFCMGMPLINPYMQPVQVQSILNLMQQGPVQPATSQTHGPANVSQNQHSNFLGVPCASFFCQNAPKVTSDPSNTSPVSAVDQSCEVKSGCFCTGATGAAGCAMTVGQLPCGQQDVYAGSVQMDNHPLPPLMPFVLPGFHSGNGVNISTAPVGMATVTKETYYHSMHQGSMYYMLEVASAHPLGAVNMKAATRSGEEVKEGHSGNGVNSSAVPVGDKPPVGQKIHHQNMPQERECDMQKISAVFSQDKINAELASRCENKVPVEDILKRKQGQKSEGKLRRPMTVPKVMQKLLGR